MAPRAALLTRLGFALLVLGLGAFELLFIGEQRDGEAALAARQSLQEARAQDALEEALRGALDVGLARLEALETLPLGDEDGLLLVEDGVQRFPRLAGAAGPVRATADDERWVDAALALSPDARAAVLRGERVPVDAGVLTAELLRAPAVSPAVRLAVAGSVAHARGVVPLELVGAPLQRLVLEAWPWLERRAAAEWCVTVQRLGEARGLDVERFRGACQRGLAGARVEVTLSGQGPRLAGEWLVQAEPVDGRPHAQPRSGLPEPVEEGPHAQPTPGLSEPVEEGPHERGALGRPVPRQARDRLGQTGGDARLGGSTLRGVRVSLPALTADVAATLKKRGALLDDDRLDARASAQGPLVRVTLSSPAHDAAVAQLRQAFALKTALLALTALLGVGVVVLTRLAARRREETLNVQREFIATVSHELRTPLAGIRLLAETLEKKLDGHAPAKDYPRRLVAAADALGFLVENLLSFNRLEAGRWVPRLQPVAPASLEPLLREDAALALDVPVEVRCEGLGALPAVQADPELLRVLVLNLLRNAWKHGQRSPVTFTVSGFATADAVTLRFADNGPGIPREAWEQVFEPFHRLDGTRARGTGLGLSLARRIAALHGGTLRVEASSEAGTVFALRLPG